MTDPEDKSPRSSVEDGAVLLRVRLESMVEEGGGVPGKRPYENFERVYDQLLRHLFLVVCSTSRDDEAARYRELMAVVGEEALRVSFGVVIERIASLREKAFQSEKLAEENVRLAERVDTLAALNAEKDRWIEAYARPSERWRGAVTMWLGDLAENQLGSMTDGELFALYALIYERCVSLEKQHSSPAKSEVPSGAPSTRSVLTLEAWTQKRFAVRAYLDGRCGTDAMALLDGLTALLEKCS